MQYAIQNYSRGDELIAIATSEDQQLMCENELDDFIKYEEENDYYLFIFKKKKSSE